MARDDMSYLEAAHAVQSGVAFDQARNSDDGSPKHLRVGINLRACDHTALVKLLIEKGIIDKDEYLEAIRVEAIEEVKRYEIMLSQEYGKKITLG